MSVPRTSTLVANLQRDADARGEILSIVDEPVSNVSIIRCVAGSIRSNHFHHSDWHFMYVLKGAIDYFYRDADTGEIKYLRVETGQNVFTPPKELHATYFPEETVLVVSSKFPRDQETYEKDTVREPLVTSENVAELLSKYGA